MSESELIELARQLIRCRSITPEDAGCQDILGRLLQDAKFKVEQLNSGPVKNMWAVHGDGEPVFVYLGHTDVVPTGSLESWKYDPFKGEISDGFLHGRGAADMKGSVAAFAKAACQYVLRHPKHKGTLALILTSDEEGVAVDGTIKVIEELKKREQKINYCLVGEPSSATKFGDTIKVGRRGSLSCKLTIHGQQGHIAYPKLADNPIHRVLKALHSLAERKWDEGNEFFDPTSFQISNIQSGAGAENVIPASAEVFFNFRFSTEQSEQKLKEEVEKTIKSVCSKYELAWRPCSQPFFSKSGKLSEAAKKAIKEQTGVDPVMSTTGGTSDGRFVAPLGAEVIEFGPSNSTIHKIDECVLVSELEALETIYRSIIEQILE